MQYRSKKMKKNPVITIIGAASIAFGSKVLTDIVNHPQLDGAEIRFVDIDERHLEIYTKLAELVCGRIDHNVRIASSTDRTQMLPGSDYIMISVETSRYDRWEEDYLLPIDSGSRQVYAELGGPGGMFHSFRQIPLHIEIGKDIARLCPDAMVTVESNPLNRICLAMEKYTGVGRIVGLCHGVEITVFSFLSRVLEMPGEEIEVCAAGTNHHVWILDMYEKGGGRNLYPVFKEKLKNFTDERRKREEFCIKLYEIFGYFPAPGDTHVGEYYPYAWEFVPINRNRFKQRKQNDEERWAYFEKVIEGEIDLDSYGKDESFEAVELRLEDIMRPRSWVDTLGFPIFSAIESNTLTKMPAVNLINTGQIRNLPDGFFVETPGIADGAGLKPLHIGDLPEPVAAFNRRDIEQTEMVVEAAVRGDRRLALQAMLIDPVADSIYNAEKILDTLLEKQKEYLPSFK